MSETASRWFPVKELAGSVRTGLASQRGLNRMSRSFGRQELTVLEGGGRFVHFCIKTGGMHPHQTSVHKAERKLPRPSKIIFGV